MSLEVFSPADLVVGNAYITSQIAALAGVTPPRIPFSRSDRWAKGVIEFTNCVVLLVKLVKEDDQYDYVDYFDGSLFWWQSQNRQDQQSPAIADIVSGKRPAFLFVRIRNKAKGGGVMPFTYCGRLSAPIVEGAKPVTCLFESLDYDPSAQGALAEIYAWRPKVPFTTEQIQRREAVLESPSRKKGAGRILDPKRRKIVEDHAMKKAMSYYAARGYDVQNTSAQRPFDLVCERHGEVRRVEVKGTQSGGETVEVTAGEIRALREDGIDTDLFVVHSIKLTGEGEGLTSSGGITRIISVWQPASEHLEVTAYRYTLPQ